MLRQITETAEQRIEANIAELNRAKQEAQHNRYGTILRALYAYAEREGNPPHELIRVFGVDRQTQQEADGIRLYEEAQMPANFDSVVFVAKAYRRREQPEQAWNVLWNHMGLWWPLDRAQVAPVVLLIDEDLAGLMSPERCESVLALPRGPKSKQN